MRSARAIRTATARPTASSTGAERQRVTGRPDGRPIAAPTRSPGTARRVHRGVLQRAARPGPGRIPAAGHRDHHLRGRDRQAVVGFQLLPRRLPVHRRRQRRPQATDVQPAAAGRARVLSRPPHRALPQGGRPRRGARSDGADDLSGEHPAMPDGRGPCRPRALRHDRPGLGGVGQEIYADLGLRFDGEHAQAVSAAGPRWPTCARTPR